MAGSHNKRGRLVAHKAKPKIDEVRNEINVTPLVDVCLVLLIIFMVILPMLERGKNVPLPETRHHSSEKDSRQPIVVIDRGGNLYVDKDPVKDISELRTRVQEDWTALAQENETIAAQTQGGDENLTKGEGRVLVKADPGISYGKVYPVILALHKMGAIGIDLGTGEVREQEGP
jgi:biopolymer transport protein ExbD